MALSGPWFNAAVVRELEIEPRPTAVVSEATTWEAFPALWRTLLDEVWEAVRGHELVRPGRNVMLYKDDVPNVEVGVEIDGAFGGTGRVVSSALPAGRVASTVHRAPFERVGAAHDAVVAWCGRRGFARTGVRWEVYGHWRGPAPEPLVEVFYLLHD
jgi:effector-binding domain-containing protein